MTFKGEDDGVRLLAFAREGRPNVRYAISKSRAAIGAWVDAMARFVPVAMLTITGEWHSMPYELLVDGKPTIPADGWDESL